ncbi:MAG: class I SAM-dependent methyltransferase [Methanobrevibacter sp.]|nr:class I SAM-dependent methyltransferase [Methanobrevibacter sp.]
MKKLNINHEIETLIEFGCGYGTFTLPSSKLINGNIFSFDIDDKVLEITEKRLKDENIKNVNLFKCDFVEDGTDLEKKFC